MGIGLHRRQMLALLLPDHAPEKRNKEKRRRMAKKEMALNSRKEKHPEPYEVDVGCSRLEDLSGLLHKP